MRENKRAKGGLYEQKAAAYLKKQGYVILETNYRCRQGEIDLIAREGETLVFVEVKYRSTARYGMPSEAVDARKQRRICNVASFYLYRNHLPADTPVRFDVAAVSEQNMEMIENAFPYCGRFG